MNVVWTDHALERARERNQVAWGLWRALVERSIEARDWEEWFEYDTREGRGAAVEGRAATGDGRGLRVNLIVRNLHGTAAVVRRNETTDSYVVVSVLTAAQYAANAEHLWSKTAAYALARHERKEEEKRDGFSPVRHLTHSPFAALTKKVR